MKKKILITIDMLVCLSLLILQYLNKNGVIKSNSYLLLLIPFFVFRVYFLYESDKIKKVGLLLVINLFLLFDYICQIVFARNFFVDYFLTVKFLVVLILMLIVLIVIFKIDKDKVKWVFVVIFAITYFMGKFFNNLDIYTDTIIVIPYTLFYLFEISSIAFSIYYLFYKSN